jgi:phosphopantothenate synthetase
MLGVLKQVLAGEEAIRPMRRAGRGAGRRRTSRAAAAVDILAAGPLVSVTSFAAGLGMAVKKAAARLDKFCAASIAVEVTHRSKRRLFGSTAWRRRAMPVRTATLSTRSDTRARPPAARPTRRFCRQRRAAGAADPADADRSRKRGGRSRA